MLPGILKLCRHVTVNSAGIGWRLRGVPGVRSCSQKVQTNTVTTPNKNKDAADPNLQLQDSISQSFVPFQDQQRIIQDVIDEMWDPVPQPEEHVYKPPPEFLIRGTTGVFELAELLDLLRKENCFEVVTISIPKEFDYSDYMVIVTCRSPRHLLSSATYVRKRFKMKSLKRTDALPRIVTESGTQGWIALDLGNIVLHLFLQAQRDHFDLEMLWTVGAVFDDLCNTKDSDIIQLLNMIK